MKKIMFVGAFVMGLTSLFAQELKLDKEEIAFGTIEDVRNRAETKLILDTLKMCNNNKTKAAERLNIARPLLYQKIKRLGIRI